MHALRDIQAAFRRQLMSGDSHVREHIVSPPGWGGDERLAVYASAYRARLAEALATDYPALKMLVGEEAFTDLCHTYSKAYPSTYYSLRWFGQHLAEFLRTASAEHLTELAGFEWTLAEAFDAADALVVSVDEAGNIPAEAWPTLRIRLHPSVRWLTLSWNVLDLWRAAVDGGPVPEPQRSPEPTDCLIWRDGLRTRYRSLASDEKRALASVASGASVATICEQLASMGNPDEVALQMASFMKIWLTSGLVSELKR